MRLFHRVWVLSAFLIITAACETQAEKSTAEIRYERAMQGDKQAQYELAQAYCCGFTAGKDNQQALNWWCQSARNGHADSQFELGRIYQVDNLSLAAAEKYRTMSIKRDNVVALAWHLLAAKNGNDGAKRYAALLMQSMNRVEKQQAYQLLAEPRSIPCGRSG